MDFHLIVTIPFGDFKKGDEITDQTVIEQILASEQQAFVNKVATPQANAATAQ